LTDFSGSEIQELATQPPLSVVEGAQMPAVPIGKCQFDPVNPPDLRHPRSIRITKGLRPARIRRAIAIAL
jgi:hypothetical protein